MEDREWHPGTCSPASAEFTTTHWSMVLDASQTNSARARRALEWLCQSYWLPLYAYVRRAGHSPEEAQDLTQEFFAVLLERNAVEKADPGRGRFRTFLLTALKHFLINEWVKAGRQKRGGGQALLSLDSQRAENIYNAEPTDPLTPDKIFERRWAATLLERVLQCLQKEYQASGREKLFEGLKDYVWGDKSGIPYAQVAEELHLTPGAVKTSVHRLRQHFRQLLRLEIAQTVTTEEEVDDELRYLISVVSS